MGRHHYPLWLCEKSYEKVRTMTKGTTTVTLRDIQKISNKSSHMPAPEVILFVLYHGGADRVDYGVMEKRNLWGIAPPARRVAARAL